LTRTVHYIKIIKSYNLLSLFLPSASKDPCDMKYSIPSFLLTTLLLCLFFSGITVAPAAAVPVLRDKVKRPAVAGQKQVQKQNAVKKSIPQEIKILGSRNDISSSKRRVSTAQPKTIAGTTKIPAVSDEPVADSDTTQTPSSGQAPDLRKKISAKSAIVMDATNGQTLFAVSPDTPRQPASTIKILTGLIAIKSLDFNESVPVSHKAAIQPSSKVHLQQQKRYKADDLINAVLLSSANDASVALAELSPVAPARHTSATISPPRRNGRAPALQRAGRCPA